jgi:uncharacterized protein
LRVFAVLSVVAMLSLAATPAAGIPIHDIQGSALVSPWAGTIVTTGGIVTGVDSRGFYMQDAVGDGDPGTSDAVFVYAGYAPDVIVGDLVSVSGLVAEYIPRFREIPGLLSTTEIMRSWTAPLEINVLSRGHVVPEPVLIGTSGILPPTERIRPDGRAFWESMEGMLVTIEDAQAVGPRLRSGEIAIVPNRGVNATGMNASGGLTLGPGDENPEWVYVRRVAGLADVKSPFADVGDLLGDVTGLLGYGSGHFEIRATEPMLHVSAGLVRETTSVPPDPDRFQIASYNVHNLDPRDPASHFAALGAQIVGSLGSPHVIALQEIQDDDGTPTGAASDEAAWAVSDVVSATATYAKLLDAIVAAGGPRYEVAQVDPWDDQDGGAPGGNIRVAFLYDPARVELPDPAIRLPGSEDSPGPFDGTRKPLVANFVIRDRQVTVINAHFSSKFGSVPLYGEGEPANAGAEAREAQALFINEYVGGLLDKDPDARVVVLGDLNTFPHASPLPILSGAATGNPILWDAAADLDPLERYSFVYGGSSQQLDHAFISASLLAEAYPIFDIVHVNTEFYGSVSDHDPIVLSLWAPGVPEPGSWMLFALGGLAVAAGRLRRPPVPARIRGEARVPRSRHWRRRRG